MKSCFIRFLVFRTFCVSALLLCHGFSSTLQPERKSVFLFLGLYPQDFPSKLPDMLSAILSNSFFVHKLFFKGFASGLTVCGGLMAAGQSVIPAPSYRLVVCYVVQTDLYFILLLHPALKRCRPGAEPWSCMLSLVGTPAVACGLKAGLVKRHRVAP